VNELYEWLSLIRLESPRVMAGDEIDSYLSRYSLPRDHGDVNTAALCTVRWQGFISPSWVRQVLVDVLLAIPARSWFALSSTKLGTGIGGSHAECTIFRPPDAPGEFILWDVHGHE
jgi:ribonucleases P/MRP protein subunit RPP40